MKVTYNEIINFIKPYYEDKDIMHNMWNVEIKNLWNKVIEKCMLLKIKSNTPIDKCEKIV